MSKWNKTKIDLVQLEKEILVMSPRSKLAKMLKRVLTGLGKWKNKSRGNPKKGYAMRGTHKGKGV